MSGLVGRSWRHLLAALALAVPLSLAGAVAAQDDAAEDWDAAGRVWSMIDEWKTTDPVGRSFQARFEDGEIALVDSVVTASLGTDEKRWGKSRSLAYTQAFVEAMNQYVARIRSRTTSRLLRNYFEEDLDESEFVYRTGESTDQLISRVATKAVVLAERKLDKALAETGMSPDEIVRLTPPQKKVAFYERLVRQVTVEAFGSAAGLMPIKTFEAFDDEGNSAIGVVAAVSSNMRQLAGRVAAGRSMRPDADRARTSITDQVGALSDDELVNEFGPRVWWDEHGYPTIVAFGQWAWSPEGLDKRKKARRRAFAVEQALSDANAHLTTFVNASTRFTKVSEQGTEAEEFSLVSPDGTVSDEETVKIIDRVVEEAQVNSTVSLTGLEVRREWSGTHPDLEGHELVGVVVSWSPAQEDRVRAELGKKPKHQPPAEKTVQKTSVSSGTAESRDLMDPADF